jgi:multidrug efflux system membrane fusion protein
MRLFPVFTALLVMIGLYFWIVANPNTTGGETTAALAIAEQNADIAPVKVVAFESEARPVQSALVLRGRTEAHRKGPAMAETSGLVVSEPLRAGARVAKGDLLCQLDVGSRAAELAEKRARLAQAKVDSDAADRLAAKGYTAETTAMAQRAALEAAEFNVRKVELDIERLTIKAPFDGVLESDTAELGQLLQPGAVCATVIDLNPIKIIGYAPETDVDKLHVGQLAGARLISGQEVRGEIIFVSRSADPTTRTFKVEITAPSADEDIRDGVTAEILIPLAGERGHFAPQAALTLDDEGRLGVRIAEDGAARFVPVAILRDEPSGVWLTGLPEKASIIIVGQEYVSDGRKIATTFTTWDPK